MLSLPRPRIQPSLIYTEYSGRLVVDRFALDPGTVAEVVGLGLMFVAFLAGVLSLGTMM